MKVYILTKTVISKLGGTSENKPKVFTTRNQAKEYMLEDVEDEKRYFNKDIVEWIKSEVHEYYWYKYSSEILGDTKIEYNIWEDEL